MIRIFTGEAREKAFLEIKRVLGANYEVFESERVEPGLVPSIFLGTSLLGGKRAILIKDLSENKASFEAFVGGIEEFLKTDAEVIILETKLDKRTAAYKELKKRGIEIKEFKEAGGVDFRKVFGIYDLAFRDGKRAVEELEKIEAEEDPYMFFGVLVSQALKKFEARAGEKEKKALKELSRLDKLMKSTGYEPWILIKGFLVRLSSL